MTLSLSKNFAAEIEAAELAGDSALLASIARSLLASTGPTTKPATRARKSAQPTGAEYLTLTERRALNLPPIKRGKIGGGVYRWVLVEFANGFRMVTGQYPDAKNPDDLSQAVISARARYLGALSGRVLDASLADQVPAIETTREIDRVEAEALRRPLMRERLALFNGLIERDRERRKIEHRLNRIHCYLRTRRARVQFEQSFQEAAE